MNVHADLLANGISRTFNFDTATPDVLAFIAGHGKLRWDKGASVRAVARNMCRLATDAIVASSMVMHCVADAPHLVFQRAHELKNVDVARIALCEYRRRGGFRGHCRDDMCHFVKWPLQCQWFIRLCVDEYGAEPEDVINTWYEPDYDTLRKFVLSFDRGIEWFDKRHRQGLRPGVRPYTAFEDNVRHIASLHYLPEARESCAK